MPFTCDIIPETQLQEKTIQDISFDSALCSYITLIFIGPVPHIASWSMIVDDGFGFGFCDDSMCKS